MIKRLIALIVLICAMMGIISSCASVNAQETETEDLTYDHIIILGFDGWGTYSFETAEMPFLKGKLPESAWTTHKRSILPTSSACNWASMFKGAGPEAHGYIAWDTQTPAFDITCSDEKGNFPSFFSIYHKTFPNREMGYIYQWEGMKYIFDMADFNKVEGYPVSVAGTDKMKEAAVSYILQEKPAVAAFIWDYPDKIGHTIGWYTKEYMDELSHIDTIIESIVHACEDAGIVDNTLFVITSDHGGHEKTHHQPLMSDLETPFMLFGKGVNPGEIKVPLMQYDVASILATFAGLEIPDPWRGKCPKGALKL